MTLLSVWKHDTRKFASDRYITDYRAVDFEVFAARRRTEVSEGGSWQLHNSDGWVREGRQSTRATQERAQVVLAHSPSNSAAGTRKLYRLYHRDTSKPFS